MSKIVVEGPSGPVSRLPAFGSQRSLRTLFWLGVVALMISTVLNGRAKAAESPWDGPVRVPGPEMFDEAEFKRALARAIAEHSEFTLWRSTAEARNLRARSRTQYDAVGSSEALSLARREFPGLLAGDRDDFGLLTGERIVGFRSSQVAVIEGADGRRSVLLASDPVAAKEGGQFKRLDLDLARRADGRFASASAAVPVAIPESADDYLRVGGADEAVGLRPGTRDVEGMLGENRVFYADVATDTDFIATPTRAGAQVMWQVRSDQAPELLRLDLDLPAGASVRVASTLTSGSDTAGDVEVVRDGKVISTISAPVAVDADGVGVPARFAFDEGQLVVSVPHAERDVRYPIMVDPEVRNVWGNPEFTGSCGGGPSAFQPGIWSYQQWWGAFTPICGQEWNGSGYGLYVRSEGVFYANGSIGQWVWSAPQGSYIMSVWFDGLRHGNAESTLFTGLHGNVWGSLVHQSSEIVWGQITQYPDSPHNSWSAVVGLYLHGAHTRNRWGWAGVRGVNLRLGDLNAPEVRLTNLSTGLGTGNPPVAPWIDDFRIGVYVRASATDAGLGLQDVGVERAGGGWYGGPHHGCAGHRGSPCPRAWEPQFRTNLLPEGHVQLHTWARDIVDQIGIGAPWIQRVDRSAPVIQLTGSLVDHASDGQLPQDPQLYIHATDGSTASPSTRRSGVKRIRVLLDGNVVQDNPNPAAECDSCPRGQTWSPSLADLLASHTVVVEAWDYLGHYASHTLNVEGSPIDSGDTEGSDGEEEPASADDRTDDPAGDGASASAPSKCRNTTHVWGYKVGPTRAGYAKLTARFCRNPTAHTTWTRDSWIDLDNDTDLAFQILGYSVEEESTKLHYNVTHRGYPRGGVHIEMKYKIKHCTLHIPLCTYSPTYHIVTYGYYHGGVYRMGYVDED